MYVKEYDGLLLPDGTTHDGWFVVNDTGGGIFGTHFDVFVGTRALRKQLKLPESGQVWFAGIEQRIPPGYTYVWAQCLIHLSKNHHFADAKCWFHYPFDFSDDSCQTAEKRAAEQHVAADVAPLRSATGLNPTVRRRRL